MNAAPIPPPARYTYYDLLHPGVTRFTTGRFVGWKRGGPLRAIGALFACRVTAIWIPYYLLTDESRAAIEAAERQEK